MSRTIRRKCFRGTALEKDWVCSPDDFVVVDGELNFICDDLSLNRVWPPAKRHLSPELFCKKTNFRIFTDHYKNFNREHWEKVKLAVKNRARRKLNKVVSCQWLDTDNVDDFDSPLL